MNYEKQVWASGDIITADKLNHMEDGIDNAGNERFNISQDNVFASTISSSVQQAVQQVIAQNDSKQYMFGFPITVGEGISQNEYNSIKNAVEYLNTKTGAFILGDTVLFPCASKYSDSDNWFISLSIPMYYTELIQCSFFLYANMYFRTVVFCY